MNRLMIAVSLAGVLGAAPAFAQNSSNAYQVNQQDRTYAIRAEQMNRAEIRAGQVAERNGGTVGVQEFGRWMAADHTLMSKTLSRIAQNVGIQVPNSPSQGQMQNVNELKKLNPAQFDRTYTTFQVQDHQRAIAETRNEIQSGTNPVIRGAAEEALPLLQQHLTEAQILERVSGASGPVASR